MVGYRMFNLRHDNLEALNKKCSEVINKLEIDKHVVVYENQKESKELTYFQTLC